MSIIFDWFIPRIIKNVHQFMGNKTKQLLWYNRHFYWLHSYFFLSIFCILIDFFLDIDVFCMICNEYINLNRDIKYGWRYFYCINTKIENTRIAAYIECILKYKLSIQSGRVKLKRRAYSQQKISTRMLNGI